MDGPGAYPAHSARTHLTIMAASAGIPLRRVDEVLDLVQLAEHATRRVDGFSMGMLQRLALAGALLGEPGVLVLDEPVNGLDPPGIVWVRDLLRELAKQGRALPVSSHLLSELAEVAERVVIIERGRLIADTPLDALLAGRWQVVQFRCADPEVLVRALRVRHITVAEDGDTLLIEGMSAREAGELAADVGAGPVYWLTERASSFEDVYFRRSSVWLTLLGCVAAAALFGVLGVAIGAIVRRPVPAIVGALAWTVLVEPALFAAAPTVFRWLPGIASLSLRRQPAEHLLSAGPAVTVLLAVIAAALVAGVRLVERDDVTG